MKKQLIVVSDMEGASGIFDNDISQIIHGSDDWQLLGRQKMTSDLLAVCEAAIEYGIEEILYYDAHYAGNPKHNVFLEKLPSIVKLFDIPDRCFLWRRIRGQAQMNPVGLITLGQHARNNEEFAYFPHTIQSPPIKALWVNDLHVAEIGMAVLNFHGIKYIANIGCEASHKEARELSSKVVQISVKDKSKKWEPTIQETYRLIKSGVLRALHSLDSFDEVTLDPPYKFKLDLCQGYSFDTTKSISWKGQVDHNKAHWEAPTIEIGFEIFNFVRELIL